MEEKERKQEKGKVVVRFAPSPTGFFHIGSARTALFNELFVRQQGGEMILRIEDTDRSRNDKKYEESILEGLKWLGIAHDQFYRQSERGSIYKDKLSELIKNGSAYHSKEEAGKRQEVIRFKNPNTEIVFEDLIRGQIKIRTDDLGDFVIAKDLETPLYHFAVSVDDSLMGVTHVIRGEDGISNTPRQILIQEALGARRPTYAHIPLILAQDRSKLSKRHGAVSVLEYRDQGYLPQAIINFLAMLGWNPGTEQEILSKEELIEKFDISKVQKGGAIFNREKLDWFNREYLLKAPKEEMENVISRKLAQFYPQKEIDRKIERLAAVLLERISVISDIETMVNTQEINYFFTPPEYDPLDLLNPKDYKKAIENKEELEELTKKTSQNLDNIADILRKSFPQDESGEVKTDFSAENVKKAAWEYAEKAGKGAVLWPMRFALSGSKRSPDPFILASILGFEETISRLDTGSQKLQETV